MAHDHDEPDKGHAAYKSPYALRDEAIAAGKERDLRIWAVQQAVLIVNGSAPAMAAFEAAGRVREIAKDLVAFVSNGGK